MKIHSTKTKNRWSKDKKNNKGEYNTACLMCSLVNILRREDLWFVGNVLKQETCDSFFFFLSENEEMKSGEEVVLEG